MRRLAPPLARRAPRTPSPHFFKVPSEKAKALKRRKPAGTGAQVTAEAGESDEAAAGNASAAAVAGKRAAGKGAVAPKASRRQAGRPAVA
jgi:hypothetical protein